MKKVSILLILTFIFYLIGQIIWAITISCDQPLFGSKHLEDMTLLIIYTLSGVYGLLSGIKLYKLNK